MIRCLSAVACTTMNTTESTPPIATPRTGGLWLASATLWQREMVRFVRQRNRVIGALATPLVFWLLLGSGLDRSFTLSIPGTAGPTSIVGPSAAASPESTLTPRMGYLAYFYPGTVVLILLFTAIFSTISVIEDRREGFLQAVLVAPIPRSSIVVGKVLGGASIATLQGLAFLLLWPLVGPWPGIGPMLGAVGMMFVLALGLTALSLCVAWPMDSTAGFHAVMNLFLMPMWFLSGAVFPVNSAPAWMRLIMWTNPLTYGQAAFSALLIGQPTDVVAALSLWWTVIIMAAFTAVLIFFASLLVARPRKDGSA